MAKKRHRLPLIERVPAKLEFKIREGRSPKACALYLDSVARSAPHLREVIYALVEDAHPFIAEILRPPERTRPHS